MYKFLNQNKYMIYISQRLHKLFIYRKLLQKSCLTLQKLGTKITITEVFQEFHSRPRLLLTLRIQCHFCNK